MAGLFGRFTEDPRMEKQALVSKYNAARMNLLLVVVFTVVNIVMMMANTSNYFLFSASIPYLFAMYGVVYSGIMPDDFYADPSFDGFVFLGDEFFYITIAVAVLVLGLYMLCWFFSKKKPALLTVALVLFIIDTVVTVRFLGLFTIIDLVFHGWVIWSLISGINANKKLKKMPVEAVAVEADYTELDPEESYETESYTTEEYSEEATADALPEGTHTEESPTEEMPAEEPTEDGGSDEEDDSFSAAKGPLDL